MYYVPDTKSLNLRGKLGISFKAKDFLRYLDSTANRNDALFFPWIFQHNHTYAMGIQVSPKEQHFPFKRKYS